MTNISFRFPTSIRDIKVLWKEYTSKRYRHNVEVVRSLTDFKAKAYDEAIERAKAIYYQGSYKPDTAATIAETLQNIFPALKESEDEEIRQKILFLYYSWRNNEQVNIPDKEEVEKTIAWLEKQGEHANFLSQIQVGDKVTRNEDGVLVNLSQLNRVAKKQGEQKPCRFNGKVTI